MAFYLSNLAEISAIGSSASASSLWARAACFCFISSSAASSPDFGCENFRDGLNGSNLATVEKRNEEQI